LYIHVHDCKHVYVHSSDTSQAVQLHNHTPLLIRPNQPCDAGELGLSSAQAPFLQICLTPSLSSVSCWNNWLNLVCTMYIHCIYTFILCIYMHIPCTWVLLIICVYHSMYACLYSPCKMYVLCYHTLIWLSVCTVFRQVYTPLEWSGQVGSFPVAFSLFCVQTLLCTVYRCTKHWHTRFRHVFKKSHRKATHLPWPF
jgi:hypothetical protein